MLLGKSLRHTHTPTTTYIPDILRGSKGERWNHYLKSEGNHYNTSWHGKANGEPSWHGKANGKSTWHGKTKGEMAS